MRFKRNSIFKVFYTHKITLSYTKTYSVKHSWVLQVSKFVPLSESHWNRELRLEFFLHMWKVLSFFISIADLYWILIYCINAYLRHLCGKVVRLFLYSFWNIDLFLLQSHMKKSHDNMVFLLLFYSYLTCCQPECNRICVSLSTHYCLIQP